MASHDLNSCLLLLFSLILTIAAEKLVSPPEVDCFDQAGPGTGGEVSLVVKETRWNVDGIMSFNTRAYWYNGVPYIPAPTIRMRPHQRCRVHISNQLSAAGSAHCGMMANRFHCGDVTSLHTHGEVTAVNF